MSIRIRLLLSYIAMILVPLLLIGVAATIIGIAYLGDFRSVYKLDMKHKNPILAVLEAEAEVSADIQLRGLREPDSLFDPKVVQALEARLEPINMGLVIRKNTDLVYISPKMNDPKLLRNLPSFAEKRGEEDERFEHGHWFIERQHDILFSDGSKGSVFIIADMNFLGRFLHTFSTLFLLSLLVILVLTNGLLTYYVSKSIIRPLRALKRAADEIKEGNLNYEVKPESQDEIGELAISFEQMRQKLKNSIELQLQYEENRKELISNISHDLKTPVTAIKGYVEGIMDGVTNSPDKLNKYVTTIYNKAVEMDRLIDELFLFSKLDLKKIPFHFEEVNLYSFLEDCIEELRFDIEQKGVSLCLNSSISRSASWVIADRDKLRRVLINIIENAVKYMDKKQGLIEIQLHETANYIVVGIEDNGQGISEQAIPYIFDRFYRADPSRNSNTGGSGLGLAIAKQIIEEHGGEIWARSILSRGTTIAFTLKKGKTGTEAKDGDEFHEKDTNH